MKDNDFGIDARKLCMLNAYKAVPYIQNVLKILAPINPMNYAVEQKLFKVTKV